jgi:hypothetical protein
MPLYQLDIQKEIGTYFYTNVYHLEGSSIAGLDAVVGGIVAAERQICTPSVNFISTRVKEAGTAYGFASIRPLTGTGAYATSSAQDLPLYNTVRVDMAPGIGPLNRKYLRTGLREDMVYGTVLEPAYITAVQTLYVNTLANASELRTIRGENVVGFTLKTLVQMRQMRRGSKRKLLPVIPLG